MKNDGINATGEYGFALAHLASFGNRDGNDLIFCMIELLPTEFPQPDVESSELRVGGEAGGTVRIWRMPSRADDALRWYTLLDGGEIPFPPSLVKDTSPRPLRVGRFSAEPEWPRLLTTTTDCQGDLPFIPGHHASPRVHHRIRLDAFELFDRLSGDRRVQVMDWLSDQLYFDFALYPEFWGSIHLVAPNPIFRSPHMRMLPTERGVAIQVPPRAGRSLAGMRLRLIDEHMGSVASHYDIPLETSVQIAEFDGEANKIGMDIYHPKIGLLYSQPPVGFIRSIKLSGRVSSRQKSIIVNSNHF